MNTRIREAVPSDAAELTAIAFAAKRHWGYPEEWIDLWTDELTVEEEYVEANRVFVATDGAGILGWCAVAEQQGQYWIDYCWVLPDAAGKGIGRQLVRHAFELVNQLQLASLKVIADPNAEGFYKRLGFKCTGEYLSVPEGRRLPVLTANP